MRQAKYHSQGVRRFKTPFRIVSSLGTQAVCTNDLAVGDEIAPASRKVTLRRREENQMTSVKQRCLIDRTRSRMPVAPHSRKQERTCGQSESPVLARRRYR